MRRLITLGGIAGPLAALAIVSAGSLQRAGAQTAYAVADSIAVTTLAPAHVSDAAANPKPSWTGTVRSPVPGTVTLTIDRVGMPDDPVDPEWPVAVTWSYTATDPAHSFTAELYGKGTDKGRMNLRGMIVSGFGAGRGVHLDVAGFQNRRAVLVIDPPSGSTSGS